MTPPPELDYASPETARRSSGTVTLVVGWLAAIVGLCAAMLFSVGTFAAYQQSTTVKGTGNRTVFREDAIRLGLCVPLAGVPSLWFIVVGHRRVTRSADSERATT